ncbi:transcriptional regulator : : HTH_3 [Gemmata massiliana]|uniref:Transcriptional regulator:: HTH_3 n=2 Tax=Gemmata massiliana TaxID=1210884 RepID=A0A6P2CXH2_9BACT|nr:transcriptional regulator : : HTH_3 [Gemmata massiliana]
MSKKKRASPAVVEQLKAAITASGQSLNQLSAASGVHRGQLSRFMAGERDLTFASAGYICEALGVALDVPESLQLQSEQVEVDETEVKPTPKKKQKKK